MLDREDVKAVRLLRAALAVNPKYLPALVAVAELLRFTGQPEKAKAFYEAVFKQD